MQKPIIAGLLIVLFGVVISPLRAAAPVVSSKVNGPSPWLAFEPFRQWMHEHLENKPFYIVTAEGRLHRGISEWRVRWTPSPRNVEWYWYWWFGSTGPQYEAEAAPLVGQKNFDQIWLQSFVDAEGVRKYQAIYLKIVWPKGMAPVLRSYESPRALMPMAPQDEPTPEQPHKDSPRPQPSRASLPHPEFD